MSHFWIMEQTDSARFPYLITIYQGQKVKLRLLAQDVWPAEGKSVFCLRTERQQDSFSVISIVERLPAHIDRRGPILSITLQRKVRKRCEFLFTTRGYKNKPGEYEQIFWRTPGYFKQRPARFRIAKSTDLTILIDQNERYPYKYPNSRRMSLPVGDYAVEQAGEIAAVVERKTFADFLTSLVKINTLHMTLSELKRYPRSALVVEAPFHYFTDPRRLEPSRVAVGSVVSLVMELYARHPGVQIVFLENRKVAAYWCGAFLEQCLVCHQFDAREQPVFRESREAYQAATYHSPEAFVQAVKRFSFTQLQANFPDWSAARLRYRLDKMRKQGRVVCKGRGLKAVWEVLESG